MNLNISLLLILCKQKDHYYQIICKMVYFKEFGNEICFVYHAVNFVFILYTPYYQRLLLLSWWQTNPDTVSSFKRLMNPRPQLIKNTSSTVRHFLFKPSLISNTQHRLLLIVTSNSWKQKTTKLWVANNNFTKAERFSRSLRQNYDIFMCFHAFVTRRYEDEH